jgi:hypothetical protein
VVRCLVLSLVTVAIIASTALADAANPWTPSPDATGEDTLIGVVDAPTASSQTIASSAIEVRGWVVDQTAAGWAGIDDVQVVQGRMEQGGHALARATIALDRPDVAGALGNPFFAASGYSAVIPAGSLPPGPANLNLYVHTPGKGWWSRPLGFRVLEAPPKPVLSFTDDPLVVIEEPADNTIFHLTQSSFFVHGYAVDRNAGPDVGVAGSGIKQIQVYLDGTRDMGTFVGEGRLGFHSDAARTVAERFVNAGFELELHPNDFALEPHALFIYVASAVTNTETLVIIPFRIQ